MSLVKSAGTLQPRDGTWQGLGNVLLANNCIDDAALHVIKYPRVCFHRIQFAPALQTHGA
ncbi:MAG: hypothetical protein SNJ59_04160 [Aggregatilineales bacterium]